MKKQSLLIVSFLLALTAKAQEGVTHIQVTDELRKKFLAEAKEADPSQIISVTPSELLKRTNPLLLQPDPSQIVTETPVSLKKKTGTLPLDSISPVTSEPKK